MGSWVVHGAAVGKYIFHVSGISFSCLGVPMGYAGWLKFVHHVGRNGRKSTMQSFFYKIAVHTPGTTWTVWLCMVRRSAKHFSCEWIFRFSCLGVLLGVQGLHTTSQFFASPTLVHNVG
jgi:hypothetical protein